MVSYCCVKGCSNNGKSKKKDPNSLISFHAFPCNAELKAKWLKAIGRPSWVPPNHSRVCSAHFSFDQINYDGCRIRIKDDAFPINLLPISLQSIKKTTSPNTDFGYVDIGLQHMLVNNNLQPNSNFEASDLEACRICLATDIKMYSIQGTYLEKCMDSVVGLSNYNIEGLPNYVCYECASYLIKSYKLVKKSMIAQATLLDIFTKNGELNKNLIKEQDRNQLNLNSSLGTYSITTNLKLGDCNITQTADLSSDNNENFKNIYSRNETENVVLDPELHEIKMELDSEAKQCLLEDDDYGDHDEKMIESPVEDIKNEDSNDDLSLKALKENKLNHLIYTKKKTARKKSNGLTPDETEMLKYFDIVKLSLNEQIKEWQKSTVRRITSEIVYECKICLKSFANINAHSVHIANHDPSHGGAECPVCKLRFKNIVVAKAHAKRAHAKKFYCKSCPKAFNNVGVAKKHQRWHSGYLYRCAWCPFTSVHESSLGVHRRRAHGGVRAKSETKEALTKEANPRKASQCEDCNIDFVSESAKRLHILTSGQHRTKTEICAPTTDTNISKTCKACGKEFSTLSDLVTHIRAEHPRVRPRRSDIYPTQCEICGESISSRKKHWDHVRREHPKERDSYRPVISAMCDTCGKGFQNSTLLRLHQLRHLSPSIRCAHCPRLFYDKYALGRHASTHCADKPHQCRTCGRAFKLRNNLERHFRVHSDVAPYECTMCGKKFKYSTSLNLHVRTVHYKLPHPPRKKRSKAAKNTE